MIIQRAGRDILRIDDDIVGKSLSLLPVGDHFPKADALFPADVPYAAYSIPVQVAAQGLGYADAVDQQGFYLLRLDVGYALDVFPDRGPVGGYQQLGAHRTVLVLRAVQLLQSQHRQGQQQGQIQAG
ncbi:hypothetical protein ADICEAN_04242 [Cesiribacter andamanensis AMV16]|uniref:Uncharacterized protein n=1 Tax=Cesiribacter andamanensis AMV16 TaxID=1279009 RepID=M7NFM9_9BACT|nr:hypothetical protein ADICEAN_04242 [Cesiribacter andamanensis AMV16]